MMTTIYLQTEVDLDCKPCQCVREHNAQLSALSLNALKCSVTHPKILYILPC